MAAQPHSILVRSDKIMEILYGYHPVNEALRAGRRTIREIWLSRGGVTPRLKALEERAAAEGVPLSRVSPRRLSAMAETGQHQGVCAAVSGFPYQGLDEILAPVDGGGAPCLLLLDSIQDPHNLGALIRTAYCAGIWGVVIAKDRSATPTPTVSGVSAGALEHTRLARVTNLVKTITAVKSAGLWVAGLDRASGAGLFQADLSGPVAIVVGSEEKGLRPLVRKNCDMLIGIPQVGRVDSLNASVAGGVVMYEVYRQRLERQGSDGSA